MPNDPPRAVNKIDDIEKLLSPQRFGIKPPIAEKTTMPIIINFFDSILFQITNNFISNR